MIEHVFVDHYRRAATDDLMSAYRALGGLVRAAEAQRSAILAVLVERDAHILDGCLDAAQWVAAADLVTSGSAKDRVKVAAALPALPAISQVVAEGGLSMEQLAPLMDIADAESDERWAHDAPALTPERAAEPGRCRSHRRGDRHDRQRLHGHHVRTGRHPLGRLLPLDRLRRPPRRDVSPSVTGSRRRAVGRRCRRRRTAPSRRRSGRRARAGTARTPPARQRCPCARSGSGTRR